MMYYPESVSQELLLILKKLMLEAELKDFNLGGGTSLALRFGHRRSVDIDLFSRRQFDSLHLSELLHSRFSSLELINRTEGSLCMLIDGCKLDILQHNFPLLNEPLVNNGIRFLSLPDLAAMKINAVTNRGSKKDFVDLYLLHSNDIPLTESLDYFCEKYGSAGRFLAIRSLGWFEDADAEPDPVFLNGWTWETVRLQMENLVRDFLI